MGEHDKKQCYSGTVKLNGEAVFHDKVYDHDGGLVAPCMRYASTYAGLSPCKTNIRKMKETLRSMYGGMQSLRIVSIGISSIINIMDSLIVLKNAGPGTGKGLFDDDGNFIGTISVLPLNPGKWEDEVICVYPVDKAYKMSKDDFASRPITKEDLKDMKENSYAEFTYGDIFVAYAYFLSSRHSKYYDYFSMIEKITSISTYGDVELLMDELNSAYGILHAAYMQKTAMLSIMEKAVRDAEAEAELGNEIYAVWHYGKMVITTQPEGPTYIARIPADDRFVFSPLFGTDETVKFHAGVTITDSESLDRIISSFPENEVQSPSFEKTIREIRDNLAENEEFCLEISGGY